MSKIYSLIIFLRLIHTGNLLAHGQSKSLWSLEECISHAISHHVDVRQSTLDLETAKAAQIHVVRNRYEYVFRKKILDFYQNKPLTL